jgi:hypothetical protein
MMTTACQYDVPPAGPSNTLLLSGRLQRFGGKGEVGSVIWASDTTLLLNIGRDGEKSSDFVTNGRMKNVCGGQPRQAEVGGFLRPGKCLDLMLSHGITLAENCGQRCLRLEEPEPRIISRCLQVWTCGASVFWTSTTFVSLAIHFSDFLLQFFSVFLLFFASCIALSAGTTLVYRNCSPSNVSQMQSSRDDTSQGMALVSAPARQKHERKETFQ